MIELYTDSVDISVSDLGDAFVNTGFRHWLIYNLLFRREEKEVLPMEYISLMLNFVACCIGVAAVILYAR